MMSLASKGLLWNGGKLYNPSVQKPMASGSLVQNQPELPSLKNNQHDHDKVFISVNCAAQGFKFPKKSDPVSWSNVGGRCFRERVRG